MRRRAWRFWRRVRNSCRPLPIYFGGRPCRLHAEDMRNQQVVEALLSLFADRRGLHPRSDRLAESCPPPAGVGRDGALALKRGYLELLLLIEPVRALDLAVQPGRPGSDIDVADIVLLEMPVKAGLELSAVVPAGLGHTPRQPAGLPKESTARQPSDSVRFWSWTLSGQREPECHLSPGTSQLPLRQEGRLVFPHVGAAGTIADDDAVPV